MTQPITFTHEARPPAVYPTGLAYFGSDDLRAMSRDGLLSSVRLSGDGRSATLLLDSESQLQACCTRTHLTAAQCCTLAMALLDAAAYLHQNASQPEQPQPEAAASDAEGAAQ